jgi:5-deoxy-glucuronate isomerase
MELRHHYTPSTGYTQLVTPQTSPVERIDFGLLRLEAGQIHELASGASELGLVALSGRFSVQIDGEAFEGLGGRTTVFDGRATGVYAPRESRVTIRSESNDLEIAICRALTDQRYPARVVSPEEVVTHTVGGPGYLRYVHDILGPQMQAGALIVGETFTPHGNWSSFPPHKHDVEAPPDEVKQEELYLYKIRPETGFGIQYLYTPPDSPYGPLDEALAVRQNDLTLMPFGYHPVAAPPGYDVYYLWFLSGETRTLRPHDDPAHTWIKTGIRAERDSVRSYPR